MDIVQALYMKIPHDYEIQMHFFREKLHLLNEQLSNAWSPLQLIVITAVITTFILSIYRFLFIHDEDISTRIREMVFRMARRIPMVKRKITEARESTLKSVRYELVKSISGHKFSTALPERGLFQDELIKKLEQYQSFEKANVQSGKVSGCVYKLAKTDMTEIYDKIFRLFGETNPLHVDVFPDIRTMEAETVRCIATMFHGDANVCGTMTSGGTESILMACKTYRDLAISKGITRPEIIMPITAHPAFNKAASYFKIKLKRIPINLQTCEVDLGKMRKAITRNTCMLVGSAPNFPHGVIDPIEEISNIATKHNIPFHVDACLGGFLIAFMDQAGFSLKPFDFRLPGVMSISCDTHKYGFAPKGTSVILYRNDGLRQCQFYALADWPGGIYGSPTMSGSRSGYLIACCWATLMYYGLNGYVDETQKIIQTAREIAAGWSKIDGLFLLHQPDVSIVAIGSNRFNIYYLYDELYVKGWHLIGLQNPPGIHIAVTQIHTQSGIVDKLLEDTRRCVADILKSNNKTETKTAAIYGTSQKIPDKSLICDVTKFYISSWYETNLDTTIDDSVTDSQG